VLWFAVGFVVAIVLWLLLRGRQQAVAVEALVERAHELENWEHDDSYDDVSSSTRIHFPSMSGEDRFATPGKRMRRTFAVRRRSASRWETRLTPESYRQAHEEAREAVADGMPLAEEQLEELQRNGRQWTPIAEELAASLETAYQRYVRAGGTLPLVSSAPAELEEARTRKSRAQRDDGDRETRRRKNLEAMRDP
jgi:hypothetical protein